MKYVSKINSLVSITPASIVVSMLPWYAVIYVGVHLWWSQGDLNWLVFAYISAQNVGYDSKAVSKVCCALNVSLKHCPPNSTLSILLQGKECGVQWTNFRWTQGSEVSLVWCPPVTISWPANMSPWFKQSITFRKCK